MGFRRQNIGLNTGKRDGHSIHGNTGLPDLPAPYRDPWLRRVLWLSVPAVLVGMAFRWWTLGHFGFGFYHDDTRSLIESAILIRDHASFVLGGKKAFLAISFYAVPVLLGKSLLLWVPVAQHLAGLVLPVAISVVCATWFRWGTLWAGPLALVCAVHPTFLWFEHLALPDCLYVVLLFTMLAIAGLYARYPGPWMLGAWLASFFLLAGARPEAGLFAPFVLALLVRTHWKDRAVLYRRGAAAVAVIAFALALSRTSQSGLLLFTSIVHWTPEHLVCEPGLAETIRPLRDRLRGEWRDLPGEYARARKEITRILEIHLRATDPSADSRDADRLAKRAAVETLARNLYRIPSFVWLKLEAMSQRAPSLGFGREIMYDDQLRVLFEPDGQPRKPLKFAPEAYGRSFASREEAGAFLLSRQHYSPALDWLHETWARACLAWRLPPSIPGHEDLPGMPVFWVIAALGLLGHAALERPWGGVRQLWLLNFIPATAAVILASNQDPRYALFLEPFWILGLAATAELLLVAITRAIPWPRSDDRAQSLPP